MLRRPDAVSAGAALLGSSIAVLFMKRPASVFLMLAILCMLVVVSVAPRLLIRSLPLVLGVPACLLVFHSIVNEGVPLLSVGPVVVTVEGVRIGTVLGARVAFVVLASLALLWTADVRELMVGLVRLGMPYRYAFAVYLALRYTSVLKDDRDSIRAAIAIRCQGRSLRLRWWFYLWYRYLLLLAVNAIRHAEATAIAVHVRGFGTHGDRTFVRPHRFTPAGGLLLALSAVAIITAYLGVS